MYLTSVTLKFAVGKTTLKKMINWIYYFFKGFKVVAIDLF